MLLGCDWNCENFSQNFCGFKNLKSDEMIQEHVLTIRSTRSLLTIRFGFLEVAEILLKNSFE